MNLSQYIDHTLLKPEATKADVLKICREAVEYNFYSVCVNAGHVKTVSEAVADTDVKVTAVVGFPLGATTSVTKAFEANEAIENGADEIDMVLNIGALKAMDYDLVKADIEAVVKAIDKRAVLKVIIETCLLTAVEKIKACELSVEAGADFVKTSTGFNSGGATAEDIQLMRKTVGPDIGVKASGGIRDYQTAMIMIEAGATRIGASQSIAIVTQGEADQNAY
ncbi:deoxyribose-phosphate aldolase [Fusibacter paucivorans]|uniref:Deoxyribose-phosphate aldolase n=2 Tax=Fusibacter paucivorans TaxID=76009 RepID=A0ABS5PTJ7_9FIRM|nr:deoxyribose-phosphate aldolase [Fusibacter paucivorans]MBS7528237.1 deoxyribose-phosphate aldolase [Fusibacter paucivorans]